MRKEIDDGFPPIRNFVRFGLPLIYPRPDFVDHGQWIFSICLILCDDDDICESTHHSPDLRTLFLHAIPTTACKDQDSPLLPDHFTERLQSFLVRLRGDSEIDKNGECLTFIDTLQTTGHSGEVGECRNRGLERNPQCICSSNCRKCIIQIEKTGNRQAKHHLSSESGVETRVHTLCIRMTICEREIITLWTSIGHRVTCR